MSRRTRNVLGAAVVLTLAGLLVARLLAEPAHVLLAGDSISYDGKTIVVTLA